MMLTLCNALLNAIQNLRKDRIKQRGHKSQQILMFQGRQHPSANELLQGKSIKAQGLCLAPFQLLTKILLSGSSLEVLQTRPNVAHTRSVTRLCLYVTIIFLG